MLETVSATNHSYYCEGIGGNDYESWSSFRDDWDQESLDLDYNHCFRFDIIDEEDADGMSTNEYQLLLSIMQQRKGRYVSVVIKHITENDLPEINRYLSRCWEYLKMQWSEFSDWIDTDDVKNWPEWKQRAALSNYVIGKDQ